MGPCTATVDSSQALQLTRSGARTRTLNNWTRTSCVANYTTPEGWIPNLADCREALFAQAVAWVIDDKLPYPIRRPAETARVSRMKNGIVFEPLMGETWVGVGLGLNPKVERIAIDRCSWNGSVTHSTRLIPAPFMAAAAKAMFS